MTNKLDYFAVHDATYAYRVSGEGEPIVLLHGFTGSMQTWHYFVKKWRDRFQVITIDLPGHGKTYTKQPKSMQSFSDDLMKLLANLNINKAHILGYSMGGRTALSFYHYYPEAVQSLTLESATPGLKTEKERHERIKQDEKVVTRISEDLTKFVNFWESIPLFDSHKQLPESVKKDLRDERLMQSPHGLIESLQYMGTGIQPSWWSELNKITVPMLLITGELDDKFVKLNKEMNKLISNSELNVITNSGHTPHIEQQEKFDKIVMTFIEKLKIHK